MFCTLTGMYSENSK